MCILPSTNLQNSQAYFLARESIYML